MVILVQEQMGIKVFMAGLVMVLELTMVRYFWNLRQHMI